MKNQLHCSNKNPLHYWEGERDLKIKTRGVHSNTIPDKLAQTSSLSLFVHYNTNTFFFFFTISKIHLLIYSVNIYWELILYSVPCVSSVNGGFVQKWKGTFMWMQGRVQLVMTQPNSTWETLLNFRDNVLYLWHMKEFSQIMGISYRWPYLEFSSHGEEIFVAWIWITHIHIWELQISLYFFFFFPREDWDEIQDL